MTEQQIFVRCIRRLLPLMMLFYWVNLLDRNNVAFAALGMNRELGFSATVYGLGAGIYFIGFVLFQVPSSLALERVGARRWIFLIALIWGVLSTSCAFVRGPWDFCTLRFLLGVAEAGCFPGMIFYLSTWFPRDYRAGLTALFMLASPLSKVLGGPLSGFILDMNTVAGLSGWRWLFLLEGGPAVLLGFVVLRSLPDGPAAAGWLTAEEKRIIAARLAADSTAEHRDFRPALRDVRVYLLGLVIFGLLLGNDALSFWMPKIVQEMGFSNSATGFVVALPYLAGGVAMILWGRSSDRKGERIRHVALAALVAAIGFAAAGIGRSDATVFAGIGITAAYGPFYALPPSFLTGPAAAAGVALIYAMGNVGGFLGPVIIGVAKERTGGYAPAMAVFSLGLIGAMVLVLTLKRSLVPPAERGALIPRPPPGSRSG